MGIPLEKKYVGIKENKQFNYKIMLNKLKNFGNNSFIQVKIGKIKKNINQYMSCFLNLKNSKDE